MEVGSPVDERGYAPAAAMSNRRLPRKPTVVAICLLVAAFHFVTGPRYNGPLRLFVTGYVIDLIAPFASVLLLGVGFERVPILRAALLRGVLVFVLGAGIETLQYFDVPIFGRTFDPLDFLMYALGIGGALTFEAILLQPAQALVEGRPV